jgi:hypothetical protein
LSFADTFLIEGLLLDLTVAQPAAIMADPKMKVRREIVLLLIALPFLFEPVPNAAATPLQHS